jgi:hypothetical protein
MRACRPYALMMTGMSFSFSIPFPSYSSPPSYSFVRKNSSQQIKKLISGTFSDDAQKIYSRQSHHRFLDQFATIDAVSMTVDQEILEDIVTNLNDPIEVFIFSAREF